MAWKEISGGGWELIILIRLGTESGHANKGMEGSVCVGGVQLRCLWNMPGVQ